MKVFAEFVSSDVDKVAVGQVVRFLYKANSKEAIRVGTVTEVTPTLIKLNDVTAEKAEPSGLPRQFKRTNMSNLSILRALTDVFEFVERL